MPIVVECPSCGQKLKVPENLEGKKVRCSKCQGTFTAEAPAPPPPPPEEPAEQPPDDDYDDRPKRRSKRRRDDEDDGYRGAPGRGGMLLTFGIVSIAGAVLTLACSIIPYAQFCSLAIPFIGLTFGILAWVMGGGDLKKIKAGSISQQAKGTTQGGYICGIVGTILNGLILFCGCIGVILVIFFGMAFLGMGAAAASMQTIKNPGPANNPAPRRSFDMPPIKLSDYLPRIDSRSN